MENPNVKVEAKVEPQPDHQPEREMSTGMPLPENPTESTSEVVNDKNGLEDEKAEAISLEAESAREDNVDDSDKVTERESILMQKVEELTKGLDHMKKMITKEKRSSTTKTLAFKVRNKIMKQKFVPRKSTARIFDKPKENGKKSKLKDAAAVKKQEEERKEYGQKRRKWKGIQTEGCSCSEETRRGKEQSWPKKKKMERNPN